MKDGTSTIRDGVFTLEFDNLVSESIKHWNVPGLSIAVISNNSVLAKGYGYSKLSEKKVTAETLFHVASMTKAFTATAVSLLMDDNGQHPDVKWAAPVSSLIGDDFVLSDNRTDQVTVEDILSHRTGLPNHDDACYGTQAKVPDTPKSVTRKLRHLPLTHPLRAKYQYSNVMFTVAAHLVETLSGQWFGDFLRQRIWEPLNMKNTYYGNEDLKERRGTQDMAVSYGWDEEAKEYFEIPWPFQPEGSGAGEMISSVLDYAEFLKCMINKTSPISVSRHEELVKPRMLTGEDLKPYFSHMCYALGWETFTYHGELVIGHDGSVDGFTGKMIYLPRLQWGFVAFANSDGGYAVEQKACWALVDDLLNVPEEKRLDWDAILEKELDELKPPSKEELYPDLPEVPIPLTLPLSAYAGEYHHPGYETLEVKFEGEKLQVDGTDRTWKFVMPLIHISGEFFIAKVYNVDTRYKSPLRAEFRLGSDGAVRSFGVEFLEGLKNDEKIWFERK